MLVFAQRQILDNETKACLHSATDCRVLLSRHDGKGSLEWSELCTESCRSLEEWMQELLLAKPEKNRIVILWTRTDPDLEGLLQFLAKQEGNFEIQAQVVLAGPLTESDSTNASKLVTQPLSNFLVYIGNEDTENKAIDSTYRTDIAGDLLQILIGAPTKGWESLGFSLKAKNHRVFTAIGLTFWGYSPRVFPKFIRQIALRILRQQLFAKPPDDERELSNSATSLVNRIRALDAYRFGDDSSQGSDQFIDQLSSSPINPFSRWRCPIIRNTALKSGEILAYEFKHDVRSWHTALKRDLNSISSDIRRRGQQLFSVARQEIRDQVERTTDLGGLAQLLKAYFPAFEKLKTRRHSRGKTPGESEDWPPWPSVKDRFVDESVSLLEEKTRQLPSLWTLIFSSAGSLGLIILSAYLLNLNLSVMVALLPGGIGILGFAGLLLWWRRLASTAAREISHHVDEVLEWLRTSYAKKLKWVTEKTLATFEYQLCSDAVALGRRLSLGFEEIYEDWLRSLDNSEEEPLALPENALDPDQLQDIETSIIGLRDDIVASALSPGGEHRIEERILLAIDDLCSRAWRSTSKHPVEEAIVESEIRRVLEHRVQPAILAKLDESALQGQIIKTLILPHAYPNPWPRGRIGAQSDPSIDFRIIRGEFTGPAVWISLPMLDEKQMQNSLKSTRVKS